MLAVLDDKKATNKDKAEACRCLLAYGFGKPVEMQEVNATVRSLEIATALKPFLDPNKKEELGRYLGALQRGASV